MKVGVSMFRRGTLILMIGATLALPLYMVENSPLAGPLALSINVSAPLIELNNLVQGSPSDSFNYRSGTSIEVGLDHVQRDTSILTIVVALTVLAQRLWLRRRRYVRHREANRR